MARDLQRLQRAQTIPRDQAARFRSQVEKEARGDEETMDFDEDYVRALPSTDAAGGPASAWASIRARGCAHNAPSIRDVILFPLLPSGIPGEARGVK